MTSSRDELNKELLKEKLASYISSPEALDSCLSQFTDNPEQIWALITALEANRLANPANVIQILRLDKVAGVLRLAELKRLDEGNLTTMMMNVFPPELEKKAADILVWLKDASLHDYFQEVMDDYSDGLFKSLSYLSKEGILNEDNYKKLRLVEQAIKENKEPERLVNLLDKLPCEIIEWLEQFGSKCQTAEFLECFQRVVEFSQDKGLDDDAENFLEYTLVDLQLKGLLYGLSGTELLLAKPDDAVAIIEKLHAQRLLIKPNLELITKSFKSELTAAELEPALNLLLKLNLSVSAAAGPSTASAAYLGLFGGGEPRDKPKDESPAPTSPKSG